MKRNKYILILAVILLIIMLIIFIYLKYFVFVRIIDPPSPVGQINYLRGGIITYYDDHKQLPSQLSWKKEIFPYIGNENYYIDMWGNQIQFILEDGKFALYSFGPNKIDEKGEGDDIFRRYDLIEEIDRLKAAREKWKIERKEKP